MEDKINSTELKYRKIRERERMQFYDYAFESTREYSENVIGIDFAMLQKMCKINSVLLGIPFKLLARNMKDIFVELDEVIVAGYSIIYDKKDDSYMLGNLFTRPEFQGRGVGNAVMQKILDEYETKTIKLSVNSFNEAALHLYRKYGFEEEYTTEEYFQAIPLEVKSNSKDIIIRLATKEDLDKLDRIMEELEDMKDLDKSYGKMLGKTEEKKLRLENHLPAIIEKNGEILGIGRASWTKGAPETAQIAAVAILPEAEEVYPEFISFLSNEAKKFGLKKFSWTKSKKTERFSEYLMPYLGEPARIGYKMSRKPN